MAVKMAGMYRALALSALVLYLTEAIPTYPTGCSVSEEIDSVYLYSCSYSGMPNPLVYSTFSDPIPQRLRIYDVNGALASSRFSGFSSFDMSSISADYTTYLQLECTVGGTLTLSGTTFTDFSYVNEVQILGCSVNLPASAFAGFSTLNKLTIHGGTISAIDATAFSGVNIQPVTNYAEPMGLLEFKKLTLGVALPSTVFSSLTTLRWLKLENLGLTGVDAALFSSNTALRGLSLRDNSLTTLSDSMFTGLDGLSELDQTNIEWDCSCTSLEFLRTLRSKRIDVVGAPVCSNGDNADHYYNTTCVTTTVCGDTPGIAIGGNCMFLGMLVGLIIISLGLIFSVIALGLTCHLRRTISKQYPKRKRAPPPPGSNPKNVGNKNRRGSGWV